MLLLLIGAIDACGCILTICSYAGSVSPLQAGEHNERKPYKRGRKRKRKVCIRVA